MKLSSIFRRPIKIEPNLFNNFPSISRNRKEILRLLKASSTPLFIIDKSILLERYQQLEQTLDKYWGNFKIAYSFKTNYEVAKSKVLKHQGGWAEVVSGREHALARKLGYHGEEIVFNGPVKTNEDLKEAITANSLIHLDNLAELVRFLSLGERYLRKARIGLRINVQLPYSSFSRFGFSLENHEAENAFQKIHNLKINLKSLHLHIGTDVDKADLYKFAAEQMAGFCNLVESRQKEVVELLDMGGGFPAHGLKPLFKDNWSPQIIDKYIEEIALTLKNKLVNSGHKTLIVEPGRYLVDDAVFFISKAYNIKVSDEVQKILSDATVTMLPLRYYRPQIVKICSPKLVEKKGKLMMSKIYGATCREDDLIAGGNFPKVQVNDYLIYYCVGAYNGSMGSDFIFGQPPSYIMGR